MVRDIVFFVGGQYLLTMQILTFNLVKEICVTTITYIIKDRFYRNSPMFVFEKFDQGGCGENGAHVSSHICDDTLQKINIANLVSLYNILELYRVKQICEILP